MAGTMAIRPAPDPVVDTRDLRITGQSTIDDTRDLRVTGYSPKRGIVT